MDLTLLEGRIGGSTVYAQSLVSELRRREDVDVSVISSGSAGGPLATARWMLAGANAGAHAAGADILHCPAFLAPLKSDVPLVITIHDLALGLAVFTRLKLSARQIDLLALIPSTLCQ